MSKIPKIPDSSAASKKSNESAYTDHLKRKSSHESSARYRLQHRVALLESERLRTARRCVDLKTAQNDIKAIEIAKEKSREASARYRQCNREALALKQRKTRKRQFIAKHGCCKFLDRALQRGVTLNDLLPNLGGARD
ncbi:hypothetical protein K438DRAFT_1974469 [Mycena galopus ATCC 62051]|nr:hypothetical protein K438DRAFT_1974469 [Mycena galopus ATCC 62051]